MIEVYSVEPAPEFGPLLIFTDGKQRRFGMRPYLHYPVFRRLENPGFFSLARVNYGTVTWPGDIDIARKPCTSGWFRWVIEMIHPAEDVALFRPAALTSVICFMAH